MPAQVYQRPANKEGFNPNETPKDCGAIEILNFHTLNASWFWTIVSLLVYKPLLQATINASAIS